MICPKCYQNVKPILPSNQCPECWSNLGDDELGLSDVLVGAMLAGVICWSVIYHAVKYFESGG